MRVMMGEIHQAACTEWTCSYYHKFLALQATNLLGLQQNYIQMVNYHDYR